MGKILATLITGNIGSVLNRIISTTSFLLVFAASADAMTFVWRDYLTVQASGPIEQGDAAKFSKLATFDTLELDSPGGSVSEALAIAANMDVRGNIRTEVKSGASCASACAMAIFVSGKTRVVRMGGRLGIHSCYKPDGAQSPECNKAMAANATAHGVPWGTIEGFGKYTKPSSMLWLDAESSECWGFMKWSDEDESNNGVGCWRQAASVKPAKVTSKNANEILCRMNAGSSRTYVSIGSMEQGFSDTYRTACKRVVTDPKTPKYAAIDIIMWLVLTDPNILKLKPGTLMLSILDRDRDQIDNCWKCLTIAAMSMLMTGHPEDAISIFLKATDVVKRDTGSVPVWLESRIEIAKVQVAKERH